MEENILFNKKLMMLTILLVSLLAISAVSAAENSMEDIITDVASEDVVSVEDNNQAIEQTENEETNGATDDGTFTALQNKINNAEKGSIITLENDYAYKESDYTIKINKSLTINGNNHAIKGSQSKIISVDGSYWDSDLGFVSLNITVKMENIRFYQGGIHLEEGSDLIVKNCSFTNNEISYDGGAIYSEGNLVVQDSFFTNNKADDGGAIYSEGNLVVQDSFFTNNKADDGGAIYSTGNLAVENCVFNENQAYCSGGAIYAKCFYDTGERIIWARDPIEFSVYLFSPIIKDSTFTDNLAGGRLNEEGAGGALYSQGYKDVADNYVDVVNSTFSGNKAYSVSNLVDEVELINDDMSGRFIATDCIFRSNNLTVNNISTYYGDWKYLEMDLVDGGGKPIENVCIDVTIVDNNQFIVETDSNGHGAVYLYLPDSRVYDVICRYGEIIANSIVNIKSTIIADNVVAEYLKSGVSATFLDTNGNALANTNVTFKAGDKSYGATTNSNGVATVNIHLGVGTYTVVAVNPVNYEQKTFNLTISNADSKIALASTQINGVTTLTATLTPTTASGNVVFKVNGENRNVQINNGKATLTLKDLEAGNYTVTASYNGDKNLNASTSNTVTFNVAEVYPILTADPVTKTYGTSTKLVVNLVDSKGNAIANADVNVNISGQITPITTDSNGQATMPINKAPGAYTATITYADAQTTAKINVKKATPKLTAKAKTFKKSVKTKKYTITLKTNTNKVMKNTKVTLKVNGKTYKATTNTKGQATFKITKLTKKGKFTAVVKYAGSKYYNAKTVKPKITVK